MQIDRINRNNINNRPCKLHLLEEIKENIIKQDIADVPSAPITIHLKDFVTNLENESDPNKIIHNGYIFRTSDDRLIVPEDVYDALSETDCTDAFEFAKSVCGEDADESKLNFYTSWFMMVQNEGGIQYCINAEDFGNSMDNIKQLIQSGRINIEEVEVLANGEVKTKAIENSQKSSNDTYIKNYILRSTDSDQLILPDEIYNIYQNSIGKNTYEYAMFMLGINTDTFNDSVNKIISSIMNQNYSIISFLPTCMEELLDSMSKIYDELGKILNLNLSVTKNDPQSYYDNTERYLPEEDDPNYSIISSLVDELKEHQTAFTNYLYRYFGSTIYAYATGNDPNDFDIESFQFYLLLGKLIEQEGGIENCIKVSDYGTISIEELVKAGKISLSNISINKNDNIEENVVENNKDLQEIQKEWAEIDEEINNILSNLTISSEKDYNTLMAKLTALEERAYNIYNNALNSLNFNIIVKDDLKEASDKYNEIAIKLCLAEGKIELLHDNITNTSQNNNKNYYPHLSNTYETVTSVIKNMSINSKSEYDNYKQLLDNYRNEAYNQYTKTIELAKELNLTTGELLQEAKDAYNKALKQIEIAERKLEILYQNYPKQNINIFKGPFSPDSNHIL